LINNINKNIFQNGMHFNVSSIHETSLKILNNIGIPIRSSRALEILDSLGCKVDFESKRVIIPESIINNTLSFNNPLKKMYDRSGEKFIDISDNNVAFSSGAANIKIKKYDGTYINPGLNDLANMTKIHDYYANIDLYINVVDPADIGYKGYRTQIAAEVFKNTTKPCSFVANDPKVVDDIYNMAVAIRGSKKSVYEKPNFTIGAASEAVLGYMDKECDLLIRCAELGIPTGTSHYPIMGLTSPVSISGSLALANANWLASQVIKTAIDPKNPTTYHVMAGVYDMKTSNVITSSPEIWLYWLMGIKLGKFYNLPVSVLVSSDSKDSDLQMAYEKAIGYFICISSGANIIGGATCELDGMNLASYEQIVIDNEIISGISHYFNNFKISTTLDDFEIIKDSINNKMYFLDSDHTLKNYKKDIWNSNIFIKNNFLDWQQKGMPKVIDFAHEKVQKILEEHKVHKLSEEIIKKIDNIVKAAQNL
jgi:trimethylamine---corrinoid protein Co-methyltransferase